ncbi:MAG: hypothetical protein GXO31_01525 [Epsilonproteobacteria bacterium]|nr:hypothetical protein [Campylobacterota bacterium]
MKSLIKFTLLISTALFLFFGCGGGGGSDSSITQTDKKYPPAILQGTTERDYIIKNGKVLISSIDGKYEKTTFTDKNGKYLTKVDKFLEPLTITLICDENSKIINKDGSEEECKEDTVIKSLTPPLYPDKNYTANITLLSDITYDLAMELGGITKENVEDAIAIISQVFGGVNPIQSDPSKGKYYAILHSLHNSGMDKAENKIAFTKALSDGYIDPNDPGEKDLLNILSSNLKRDYQANLITESVNKNRIITIITPTETSTNEDPNIKEAKDMLSHIRQEVLSIKNYKDPNNPSVYDKELENFKKVESKNVFPNATYIGSFVQKITDLIKKSEEENLNEIKEEFYRENDPNAFSLTLKKETQEPRNYESWDYVLQRDDLNYTGTFTYIPQDEQNASFKNAKAYSFFGSLPLNDKNLLKERSKDLEEFKGKATRFDNNETSYYLILSARIKTESDNNQSVYTIKDSKYLVLKKDPNDISSIKSVRPQFIVLELSISQYLLKGTFRFYDYKTNNTFKRNGHELPSLTKFTGRFQTQKTDTKFNGDLQLKIKNFDQIDFDKDEKLLYEAKMAGEFYLPQRDKILLTIYSDEISNNKYYTEVTYTSNNKSLFASGDITKNQDYFSWDITIRNEKAISMHVIGDEKGDFRGEVTKNNEIIGKFEKLNDLPIVRFKDGTFESIP